MASQDRLRSLAKLVAGEPPTDAIELAELAELVLKQTEPSAEGVSLSQLRNAAKIRTAREILDGIAPELEKGLRGQLLRISGRLHLLARRIETGEEL